MVRASATYERRLLRRELATWRERLPDFATFPRLAFSRREDSRRESLLPFVRLDRPVRAARASRFDCPRDAAGFERDFLADARSAFATNNNSVTRIMLIQLRYIERSSLNPSDIFRTAKPGRA